MRVTSKGQVTIPKDVRDKLGIAPGDEVGFREEGASIVLENLSAAAPPGPGNDLRKFFEEVDRLKREGGLISLGMPVDDHMDMVRGYGDDADDPGFQHRS